MRVLFFCVCILPCLFCASVSAQKANTTNPNNAKKTNSRGPFGVRDAQLIESYLVTIEGVGSTSRDFLAEQSVKSYMMPPRQADVVNQSGIYALTACFEYYQNLNSNYKDNLSPDFVRLNITENSIEKYLSFLAEQGTVSAAIFPFGSNNLMPSVQSAVKFHIKNYLHLFQNTTKGQQKVYELRKALLRGHPVVIELPVDEVAFSNLKQMRFWQYAKEAANLSPHYVVVVSYNDDHKMFEIMNSQGKAWGNGGYLWMTYDDIANYATHGYVIVD